MKQYKNNEFERLGSYIYNHDEFLKLNNIAHHGHTRYDHCMRVGYYTYKVTKFLHLNYREATKAALLHDFFTDEVKEFGSVKRLQNHPSIALENARKYFDISDLGEDIILTHMFPITFIPPKYLESWIVDFIDDGVAIYEKYSVIKKQLSAATTFLFLVILNIFRLI